MSICHKKTDMFYNNIKIKKKYQNDLYNTKNLTIYMIKIYKYVFI